MKLALAHFTVLEILEVLYLKIIIIFKISLSKEDIISVMYTVIKLVTLSLIGK